MSEGLILIVEDSPHVASTIADVVELTGYASRIASTGEEAFAALQEQTPVLVILDRILPDMDGIEILERIRAGAHSELPILMLTARGELTARLAGLEAGADDYIPKPFNLKELQARISAVMRRTA